MQETILRLNNIRINIIAAVARNGVIGNKGSIPWDVPEELQFFKATTMGCPVIMGTNTFMSLKGALPGRENIVITSQSNIKLKGVTVVQSLEEALDIATIYAYSDDKDDVFVIGGAKVYESALKYADRMYISEIKAWVDGDTFFPVFNATSWETKIIMSNEHFITTEYMKR